MKRLNTIVSCSNSKVTEYKLPVTPTTEYVVDDSYITPSVLIRQG